MLVALSRDHHHGLILTGRIAACGDDVAALSQLCDFVFQRFSSEMAPHFQLEEERIFPVLAGVHEKESQRAIGEHHVLTQLAARIADGDLTALKQFSRLLASHMRFEEHVLYPLYLSLLPYDEA